MRFIYITFLICTSLIANAQKASTPWGRQVADKKANPYTKIKAGAATIGVGGILLAGSVVALGEAKLQENKVPAYILAGGGGVLCFIGGVLLGNGAKLLDKQQGISKINFTGSGFTLRF